MNQQLLNILRGTGFILSLLLFCISLGAQEMIFMESGFDPMEDHAQLLPADQTGSVSWTAATKTLHFKNVKIECQPSILEGWMPEEITISVEGTNQLVCTGLEDAISMRSSVRITGSGSISITAKNKNAYACRDGANLTIADGVSVTVVGAEGGIVGDFISSKLLIDKSYVKASTINNEGTTSIGYFHEINIKDCAITSPSGAKVADLNDAMSITVDGQNEYTGEVIIAPQQTYHTVSITNVEHGHITAPEGIDLTRLQAGTSITFKAVPDEGYILSKLMAGTEDITNTLTLVVKGDVTVTPTFSPVTTYRVTLQKPENGTLTVRETEYDLTKVPEGSILHFICTPNEGYELEEVRVGEQDITESLYTKVEGNIEVTARYRKIPVPTHKVTIRVLGAGEVTTDCNDLTAVPEGTTIHFTCTPKSSNHYLSALKANGEDITESKSITIIDEDVNIIATFMERTAIEAPQGYTTPTISHVGEVLTISSISINQAVALVSLKGETILRKTAIAGQPLTINLTGLPKGIYILAIGASSYKLYL